MDSHIPVLIRKLDTLKLKTREVHEPIVDDCYSCGSKIFYVTTTKGLVFSPYANIVSAPEGWKHYEIVRTFTHHVCAQCGTHGDSIGHWEHCIMEFEDSFDVEEYEDALWYLQTGELRHSPLIDNALQKVEEMKQAIAKYWTRHNIADAVKRVKEEQERKSTTKEVKA